jgi:hypothetical protein
MWELQRATWSSVPSRSKTAASPASEDDRINGSPRESSVETLVAQLPERNSFSPLASERSRKADDTTPCSSTSWIS